MSEIRYEGLPDLLEGIKKGEIAPVYLLYGDEFLYKSAFKALLDSVVSPKGQALNYEALDGQTASIYETVERLNTFPLLQGEKVIAVQDTNLFSSKINEEEMVVPAYKDDADVLDEAIIKGFPETNHLILTTEFVDKRRKVYKTIKAKGVAIDCSVPMGDRAADKRQHKEVMKAHTREILRSVGKAMTPGGFEALYEKAGGSLRNFSNELEKVITFVGERHEILADDVEEASEKTRQDPIYELGNAIGERATGRALSLLDSLLKANFFPLQILSAAINQVRKLLLARDFIRSEYGGGWKQGLSYRAFQKAVWPEMEKREPDFLTSKAHPYVIYKTLQHSDNYTVEELATALEILLDADIRLKTSAHDARVVLEHAMLRICGTPAPGRTLTNQEAA